MTFRKSKLLFNLKFNQSSMKSNLQAAYVAQLHVDRKVTHKRRKHDLLSAYSGLCQPSQKTGSNNKFEQCQKKAHLVECWLILIRSIDDSLVLLGSRRHLRDRLRFAAADLDGCLLLSHGIRSSIMGITLVDDKPESSIYAQNVIADN